ncbi:unnamed protein product [Tuber aestivum]|uniref:Uncharacterized protein n=1 Tax=Tuber aestivum TaxID=59557 RepID=A0A292Q2X9_9PEZI|nr:unnamed protein product [Tuber aestivum]
MSAEGTHPLAAHGIALVCHCRRADLVLLEGLFHFLHCRQVPDVRANALARSTEGAHGADDIRIHLARVCEVMGYAYSKPANWVTRLSNSSTLSWSPLKIARKEACVPVVPFTPRKPRSERARVRLRRSMRRSWIQRQARFPTVFVDYVGEFGEEYVETLAEEEEVGVVGAVTAGG